MSTKPKEKKAATPAPAPVQPVETEPSTILPFGEGESNPGGSGDTATGTEPEIQIVDPAALELVAFRVEDIPHLVFTDASGARFYLDPWMPRGHYILRDLPGG